MEVTGVQGQSSGEISHKYTLGISSGLRMWWEDEWEDVSSSWLVFGEMPHHLRLGVCDIDKK